MVSESIGIVNINYPAKRVCMTVIHGLSQISYDWTIRVHADGSHQPDFGEQHKDSKLYMSQTEQSNDINLPLHKHLRL